MPATAHTLSHLCRIVSAVDRYDWRFSQLLHQRQRPATPNDMNLAPEQELLFTELIMDGRILEDNLKRMGLDLTWLDKQMKQRNIYSPKDVFLAVCDRNLKFVLYEKTSTKKWYADFRTATEMTASIGIPVVHSYSGSMAVIP